MKSDFGTHHRQSLLANTPKLIIILGGLAPRLRRQHGLLLMFLRKAVPEMKRLILCLTLVTVAGGCGLTFASRAHKMFDPWLGRPASQFVASAGTPLQSFSDGQGGRVLVYAETQSYVVPATATTKTTRSVDDLILGNGNSTSETVFTPAQVRTSQTWVAIFVNGKGTIYQWRAGQQ